MFFFSISIPDNVVTWLQFNSYKCMSPFLEVLNVVYFGKYHQIKNAYIESLCNPIEILTSNFNSV